LNKILNLTILIGLSGCLIIGLIACGISAPPNSISDSPAGLSSTTTTQGVFSTTSSSSPTVSASPDSFSIKPSPTTSLTVEIKPAEVSVVSNKTGISFPNSMNFILEATSPVPFKNVTLEFSTNQRSIVEEITKVQVPFNPGTILNANYSLEFKKQGSFPPKVLISYQWRITDSNDRFFLTPKKTVTFEDTRFNWENKSLSNMDIYWHDQDTALIDSMLAEVEVRLSGIKLNVSIPPERKIKVVIYKNYDEIKSFPTTIRF
jgi:hypothetical protein